MLLMMLLAADPCNHISFGIWTAAVVLLWDALAAAGMG